jgi:hypothetical protein
MKGNILTTANATSTPTSEPPKKKSRKTLIALVLVVVLIVAIVAGVYLATRGNGNTNPSTSPTPTPTSNPSATSNPSTSGTGANVAGATSLQFTVSVTNSSGGSVGSYTYYVKNAGTSSQMVRIDFTDPSSGDFVYIVNSATQQVLVKSGGQWTDLSSTYTSQYNTWNTAFLGYKNSLTSWSGTGDWTYTDPNGDTVKITNISVNPTLPDSLFQQS